MLFAFVFCLWNVYQVPETTCISHLVITYNYKNQMKVNNFLKKIRKYNTCCKLRIRLALLLIEAQLPTDIMSLVCSNPSSEVLDVLRSQCISSIVAESGNCGTTPFNFCSKTWKICIRRLCIRKTVPDKNIKLSIYCCWRAKVNFLTVEAFIMDVNFLFFYYYSILFSSLSSIVATI